MLLLVDEPGHNRCSMEDELFTRCPIDPVTGAINDVRVPTVLSLHDSQATPHPGRPGSY